MAAKELFTTQPGAFWYNETDQYGDYTMNSFQIGKLDSGNRNKRSCDWCEYLRSIPDRGGVQRRRKTALMRV